ncbi:MAG: hypothetical protein JJU18_01850 [Oceanicaulis sp.]|nr:hypothetical protein [Oceanicaulis sp.]
MFTRLAMLALGAAFSAAGATAHAQLNISVTDRNGACFVAVPAGENGLRLEFSVRASDLNTNVVLHNVEGDYVNAGIESGEEPEIDLIFDGGHTHELDWGTFRAGFTYFVGGGWDEADGGHNVLRALRTASTVTFRAGDRRWENISLQTPGVAYALLENCVIQNGGDMMD